MTDRDELEVLESVFPRHVRFWQDRDFESVLGEINSEGPVPEPEQTGKRGKKPKKPTAVPDLDDEQQR